MEISLLALIPFYLIYIAILGIHMFKIRVKAVRDGKISTGYFKTYQGEVPREVMQVGNHFNNQFQVPPIFFITVLAVILLDSVSLTQVILAYSFVLSSLVHTYIHLGSNKLYLRAGFYFLGVVILITMWFTIILTHL
jgi:hypothetical protein